VGEETIHLSLFDNYKLRPLHNRDFFGSSINDHCSSVTDEEAASIPRRSSPKKIAGNIPR
jgi:hypothetical protein